MYIKENTSEAPQIKRVNIEFNARFKPKNAKFDIYERETGTLVEVEQLEIIPISDSRFTVKDPQSQKGIYVWSGLYQNAKQIITIMQKKDGKVSILEQGDWKFLKFNGYKYVKILHCLIKVNGKWKTCEFELAGISAIMWGNIRVHGTEGIMKLQISSSKDFETARGNFHSMTGFIVQAVPQDVDDVAKSFATEIMEMYESYDENYKFYNEKNRLKEEEKEEAIQKEVEDDIPVINIDEEEKNESIDINSVPF